MRITPEHDELLQSLFDADSERELRARTLEAGLSSLRRRRRVRALRRLGVAGACLVAAALIQVALPRRSPGPAPVAGPGPSAFERVSTRSITTRHLVARPAPPRIERVNTRTDALSRIPRIGDAELLESFGDLPRMLLRRGAEVSLIFLDAAEEQPTETRS